MRCQIYVSEKVNAAPRQNDRPRTGRQNREPREDNRPPRRRDENFNPDNRYIGSQVVSTSNMVLMVVLQVPRCWSSLTYKKNR